MKSYFCTMLFSFAAICDMTPSIQEKAIISDNALHEDRCLFLNEKECEEERKELYRRGCISAWALKELENKRGPRPGQKGGYPLCTVKNQLKRWCYCGCFHPETRILVFDRKTRSVHHVKARLIVEELSRYELVVLDENANRNAVTFTSIAIQKYTHGPEKPALVIMHLSTGRQLKVSSQHAIMLADGRMIAAERVKEGDDILGFDTSAVAVLRIEREKTNEEVINFMTVGDTLRSHMIIAEGIVVGDVSYQNDLVPILNAEIL